MITLPLRRTETIVVTLFPQFVELTCSVSLAITVKWGGVAEFSRCNLKNSAVLALLVLL
ncbi:hypothetical protein AALB_0022 [Agarivorans albus MKT 106]|uniref:Uncharacterized protein n=1 Tax=Agarivorans albus MKT 106 TaxID=1331007 RepID=R9PF18_AGAAL|nr:hypothetical protein AALB_0022 [Agarivorans albus MKT 106]